MNPIIARTVAMASMLVSGAADADAVVLGLKGTAMAWAGTEPRRALKVGDSVKDGEYVATSGADSSLTLGFEDRTTMTLRANSTLRLKPKCIPGDPACPGKSIVDLTKGSGATRKKGSETGETPETRP